MQTNVVPAYAGRKGFVSDVRVFAEFERAMIHERIRAGLSRA